MASESVIQTEFEFTGYGKNYVKLLYLRRDGDIHYVKELEVSTELTLNNVKDYTHGDNSDIIATDSQKNTVYVMAKQHGVKSAERFALLLCEHFLRKYRHVTRAKVYIEEAPWKRMEIGGQQHVHAFLLSHEAKHVCEVEQYRDKRPTIWTALSGMKVMKTTQSAFKNFVSDEFRTLPDADDRLFCTIVQCKWWYNTSAVNFERAWEGVKSIILEIFAGPPDRGEYSPSVQNTLYLTAQKVLEKMPEVEKVYINLPNVHYFGVDYSRFPKIDFSRNDDNVYMPTDKPSGNINATIARKPKSRL